MARILQWRGMTSSKELSQNYPWNFLPNPIITIPDFSLIWLKIDKVPLYADNSPIVQCLPSLAVGWQTRKLGEINHQILIQDLWPSYTFYINPNVTTERERDTEGLKIPSFNSESKNLAHFRLFPRQPIVLLTMGHPEFWAYWEWENIAKNSDAGSSINCTFFVLYW